MTTIEFNALLERREQLQESHSDLCDEVSGRFGAGESSYEARVRDNTWAELDEIEERIAQAIEEEGNQ
jgi:hypothetical protein